MSKSIKIIANTIDPEEMRVAILEEDRLREVFIERMWERQKSGEIYKARVESVLPGMNASFVNLGDGRNAFLYLNDARGYHLKPGMDVVVQVVKTARKNKGARVTTRLSLPGRYLVIVPGGREVGVSKRIDSDSERQRLRSIARSLSSVNRIGIIIRTAAEGMDRDVLESDFEALMGLWRDIEHNVEKQSAPCLIYRDLGLTGRVLRDEYSDSVLEIITDNEEEQARITEWLDCYGQGKIPDISLYEGNSPIFEYFGLEKEIEAALDQKIWLRSGAYIVIDQTEAMTVIDVNTGKYVGHKNLSQTVFETNMETAEEIAWQMRLRAIGGIVIVDFIDMEREEDRKKLVRRLEEVFQEDRCRTRVFGVTHLGLVEITRKRARADIRSVLMRNCPFCGMTCRVLKEDSVSVAAKRFIRKVVKTNRAEALLLELHPDIARYVAENYLSSWEELFQRKIVLKAATAMGWDKYRLDFQGTVVAMEAKIEALQEDGVVVYSTTSA